MGNFRRSKVGRAVRFASPLLLVLAGKAFGYEISCSTNSTGGPNSFVANPINGTFAEPRGAAQNTQGTPRRFHAGVDVTGQCLENRRVYPIESGSVQVTGVPACLSQGTIKCIRVIGDSGRIFDYEHVDWTVTSLADGSRVSTATRLGNIQLATDGGNHLHLNQITRVLGSAAGLYRINPQIPLRLSFSDSDTPAFGAATIGSVSNRSVILIKDQTTTPYELRNNTQYVRGDADVYVTASVDRAGSLYRKGLHRISTNAYPIRSLGAPGARSLLMFDALPDGPVSQSQVLKIYYQQQTNANTSIPTNVFVGPTLGNASMPVATDGAWITSEVGDGPYNLCVNLETYPNGPTIGQTCFGIYLDNTPAAITMTNSGGTVTNGGASSAGTITIGGVDPGGIKNITLTGPSYSSTSYSSGVQTSFSNQFPDAPAVLADGEYTTTVVDLAGNSAQANFSIYKSTPTQITKAGSDPGGTVTNPITPSDCIVAQAYSPVGIEASWSDLDPSTVTYDPPTSTVSYVSLNCDVATGIYNFYFRDRAGNVGSKSVTISSGPYQMTVSGSGQGWSDSNSVTVAGISGFELRLSAVSGLTSCTGLVLVADGQTMSCQPQCPGCQVQYSMTMGGQGKTISWSATNPSAVSSFTSTLQFGAELAPIGLSGYSASITFNAAPHPYNIPPGGSIGGQALVPAVPGTGYTYTLHASTLSVTSPFNSIVISTRAAFSGEEEIARLRQVLRLSGHIIDVAADGGMAVFKSTMTMNFAYADSVADTTTAHIYRFRNSSWEYSSISSQSITRNGADVTATGVSTNTATFAVFFAGQDSSAPVTSYVLQGSSFVFNQSIFVSTDVYFVLNATDPVVSGYASTVASVTYRLDPVVGTAFSIYSASFPVALGTHILEYRSIDYAGNLEGVKTATFTVTAGTAFRGTGTAAIPGNLLNGFLGAGAKVEVGAAAQDSYALLISSADGSPLAGVAGTGGVGIGVAPQAALDIGQGAIGLQLRSGNSTSAVTSEQIAFGYDGDYSMSHLLRTEHSTSTDGNKMDFLVWNPGAGSTATAANLNVLTLQGIKTASNGSFHVHPVGEPDAEVEVSDGLTTGGGTIQRLQLLTPSSRRFKTDIHDLDAQDEARALEDVLSLRHVDFKYRNSPQSHIGLIYEDAPASIRDGANAISTTERLANVEMALKASIKRLEELRKRYAELKAKKQAGESSSPKDSK